jgi:hypothetical protein
MSSIPRRSHTLSQSSRLERCESYAHWTGSRIGSILPPDSLLAGRWRISVRNTQGSFMLTTRLLSTATGSLLLSLARSQQDNREIMSPTHLNTSAVARHYKSMVVIPPINSLRGVVIPASVRCLDSALNCLETGLMFSTRSWPLALHSCDGLSLDD